MSAILGPGEQAARYARAIPRAVEDGRLGLALVVTASAQLMVVLDATIVNVALPHIQRALGLCRADDSKATRLMQSAIAGFACPSIIPERERPLKYRHLPTRSPGWSGLDPAVPDSHETGQSAPGNRSIRSACEGRNIRRSVSESRRFLYHAPYLAKLAGHREISADTVGNSTAS